VFDPFWATVAEAGVPVVFHVSNSGYQHFYGTHWSENPDNPSHRQSPLQWALFKTVGKAAALGRRGPMLGGQLPPRPSEALAGHLWVCPFPEDDVTGLIEAIGADHVLFGSDYPHPEGLREPRDFAGRLDGCDAAVTRQVLPATRRACSA
jgi:predicted TIM-barrel fold metal-dependent hydrolase